MRKTIVAVALAATKGRNEGILDHYRTNFRSGGRSRQCEIPENQLPHGAGVSPRAFKRYGAARSIGSRGICQSRSKRCESRKCCLRLQHKGQDNCSVGCLSAACRKYEFTGMQGSCISSITFWPPLLDNDNWLVKPGLAI